MPPVHDMDNSHKLEGVICASDFRQLAKHGALQQLSVSNTPVVTERIARGMRSLISVDQAWLWCRITRTAMRHVLSIPGLRVLDVMHIAKPGRLADFSAALSLEVVRANQGLDADDLLAIATCRSLRELGAQGAELSPAIIDAILAIPHLASLDLESAGFDDTMAEQLNASTSIASLDVGSTLLSPVGLAHLCSMKQLRSLDLWYLPIQLSDLGRLADLPLLEYLSVGGCGDVPPFSADTLIPALSALPSLKRIWLDGIDVTPAQREDLFGRYDYVRIT